jgi:phosphocarrier protein FPr/phosphocarrier protein
MSDLPMRLDILAPLSGVLVPLARVPDPVFAAGTVGEGVAIDPTSSEVLAPVAGVVTVLHRAHHALTITTDAGVDLLVHVGIDTVAQHGSGFTAYVAQGDRVAAGQRLLSFDADALARRVPCLVTPLIVTNPDRLVRLTAATGFVEAGRDVVLALEVAGPPTTAARAAVVVGRRRSVRLPNADGLHARPAAVVAAAAKRFRADVHVIHGASTANAKSVVALMLLATKGGDELGVEAVGADAEAAVQAVAALLASGAGDELGRPGPAVAAASAPGAAVPPVVAGELRGTPASPGLAVGRVVQLRRELLPVDTRSDGPVRERERLESALTTARRDLEALKVRLGTAPEARILEAHHELLADPELIDGAIRLLAGGASAAEAWRESYSSQAAGLAALPSPLLRERANDVRDVGERVLALLAGVRPMAIPAVGDSILIADDLTPSEAATLDTARVRAFCTLAGTATSHVALLARSLGIPAICGIDPAARTLADGATVVLDGERGVLQAAPSADELVAARARLSRLFAERTAEQAAARQPAVTRDGHRIEVAANVRDAKEAQAAVSAGADGVGLLRSEFLFVDRDTAPTEAEQREAYQAAAAALGRGRRLVIRTLDVGGDKPLAYLTMPTEANPFLGMRGIRVGLAQPELLRGQLRAILTAAPLCDLHVMFPMIATLEELRTARGLLTDEAQAVGASVRVGVMVEVPSAALIAERLAAEVDFLSIGTNDLTQYALAMDRGDPRLADQADALHPAVLRLIAMTVDAAHRHGKWVGVCGGLASEPLATPALVGLGVDELSVAVPAIGAVKARIARASATESRSLATELLGLGTAAEVRSRLKAFSADR